MNIHFTYLILKDNCKEAYLNAARIPMTSHLEVTGKIYQGYSNTVQNWCNRLAVSDNFFC